VTPEPQPVIAVISNRNSGHNRDRLGAVAAALDGDPRFRHFITDAAEDIPGVLGMLAGSPLRLLVINGGDGTAAAVFAQLCAHFSPSYQPLLALLPGGTANMTAGDVGIRGSLHVALRRLQAWAAAGGATEGLTVERHVLRVDPGAQPPRYGMFFGAGVIMQGTAYAHRELHARGLRDDFSLGLGMVRTLWGLVRRDPEFWQPLPVAVRSDAGAALECDALILAVSTLDRLFLGLRPFWGSDAGPLKWSLIESRARRLLGRFPGILRGRPGRAVVPDAGYHSHRATRVTLEMDGRFNLDGEIVAVSRTEGPVVITAAGPLRFLRL
jgi:diacylglycerol kinase (ATP)